MPSDNKLLNELLAKVPKDLKPIAIQYAPWLLELTKEEAWIWIGLLLTDWKKAYEQVIQKMSVEDVLNEWTIRNNEMASLNIKMSARKRVFEEAASAILLGLLKIVLVLVGL